MADTKSIKGLSDLQKMLDKLPAKVEANIMRGALRAGANEFKKEAKRLCPVGPPSARAQKQYGGYAGALRDTIRVSVKREKRKITATVKAGGKTKSGAVVYYAHMIEYTGSIAHPMIKKYRKSKDGKRKILNIAGMPRTSAQHPGMKAQPFMRTAWDNKNASAVVAAGNYVKKRLSTKHGLDTAGINVEVKE